MNVAGAADRPPDGRRGTPDAAESRYQPAGRLGRVFVGPVVAYRRWISPAMPARCRFYPSCSAYALEAVAAHGVVRGAGLAIWRLLRCQPFNPGGYDPVPPARHRAEVTGA